MQPNRLMDFMCPGNCFFIFYHPPVRQVPAPETASSPPMCLRMRFIREDCMKRESITQWTRSASSPMVTHDSAQHLTVIPPEYRTAPTM